VNQLQLQGQIVTAPDVRYSPSGIGHAEFWFEHRSMQYEGSLQRQAYCKMRTVVGGELFKQHAVHLEKDTWLQLMGFLNMRQMRNGAQELVFYVQSIELSKENL
jgi:primosomal replication protein PriB